MSLLAEVLKSAEKAEIQNLEDIPHLMSQSQNYKAEVLQYLEAVYVKYSSLPKHMNMMLTQARRVEGELRDLHGIIDSLTKKDLEEANVKIEGAQGDLLVTNHCIKLVIMLTEIHNNLLQFDIFFKRKEYMVCMTKVNAALDLINSVPDDECLDTIIELQISATNSHAKLMNKLTNIFKDNVVYNNNNGKSVFKIKHDTDELQEALFALYMNEHIYPLDEVRLFFFHDIFMPIVSHTTAVNIKDDDMFKVLEIHKTADKNDTYNKVFKNIEAVAVFLGDNFNFTINENLTVMSYIGVNLRDNLSELIITKCLQNTIPSTDEGLAKYKIVIEDTDKLHKLLVTCDIFAEDTISIIEYANNIDVLFMNKKCDQYYKQAERIMQKDLHDMIEVGVPYDPNSPLEQTISGLEQCSISKSVIELTELVNVIMEKAVQSSPACAGRLFVIVQKIIANYGTFVAEYHKKLLQTIPQQIALFYNNCKYIVDKMQEWNATYSLKLAPVLSLDNCSFKMEDIELEKIADELFTKFVEGQIKQIADIMKDAGLTGESLTKLEPVTEKSVRQCLRQQELLKTVWSKVLSYTNYNRSLGVIFDSLCVFIIDAVVKFADIPSDVAEQLVDVIKIILNRGPKLFTDPNEISLYVKAWYKINELNFVLSSNLININDRWADGKGPLALQFKAEEVRQLIRALFQNTDRRAAVLSRIV